MIDADRNRRRSVFLPADFRSSEWEVHVIDADRNRRRSAGATAANNRLPLLRTVRRG